jgi:hypothetical protein
MQKLLKPLALMMAAMLVAIFVIGCGGDEEPTDGGLPSATTVTANPAGGSTVPGNATITLTFDQAVKAVAGATGSGKVWTIPVAANLSVTWTNQDGSAGGPVAFTYTLQAEDKTAPTIASGSVSNGDKDVEVDPLNTGGISLTFSEDVTGNIKITLEDGTDLGWIGTVSGKTAKLELVKGKDLANETTYKIAGAVKDGAGNETKIDITFVTKGKE